MILRDGRDCVVYDAILAMCCDVAVALRMTSCMCCFHCNCLCSVIPRYVYVSTMEWNGIVIIRTQATILVVGTPETLIYH